jgi:hypothetical protein
VTRTTIYWDWFYPRFKPDLAWGSGSDEEQLLRETSVERFKSKDFCRMID